MPNGGLYGDSHPCESLIDLAKRYTNRNKEFEMELERAEKEIKKLKKENDILKESIAIIKKIT